LPQPRHVNNAVVVSDLHCGCRAGLYPCDLEDDLLFDMGVIYRPSNLQKEMWEAWLKFWQEFVPEATRNEDYVFVLNGDGLDGRHHDSVTQISQNLADQKKIAKAILKPILKKEKCKSFYWIRGTEAHSGASSELEESLAEDLEAIRDSKSQYSRDTMWLRLGGKSGALVHFAHTIGTTSRTAYETSAVMAELTEQYVESGRWLHPAADITVRSHRHRFVEVRVPSARGYTIGTVTPGWQGPTPFTRRLAGGRQSEPQFGGVVIRQGDHDHYTRSFVVSVEREPEVVV